MSGESESEGQGRESTYTSIQERKGFLVGPALCIRCRRVYTCIDDEDIAFLRITIVQVISLTYYISRFVYRAEQQTSRSQKCNLLLSPGLRIV